MIFPDFVKRLFHFTEANVGILPVCKIRYFILKLKLSLSMNGCLSGTAEWLDFYGCLMHVYSLFPDARCFYMTCWMWVMMSDKAVGERQSIEMRSGMERSQVSWRLASCRVAAMPFSRSVFRSNSPSRYCHVCR